MTHIDDLVAVSGLVSESTRLGVVCVISAVACALYGLKRLEPDMVDRPKAYGSWQMFRIGRWVLLAVGVLCFVVALFGLL